ncbi:MAG: hypothetical protein HC876_19720 [Chloroflexaceae bacterium]|nr:hypothetical protein [Chloroflexaceae bacterium]
MLRFVQNSSLYAIVYLLFSVWLLGGCAASLSTSTATPVAPEESPTAADAQAAPLTQPELFSFEDIPQSRTAEGYPVLGVPDAAATIVMYSDFF